MITVEFENLWPGFVLLTFIALTYALILTIYVVENYRKEKINKRILAISFLVCIGVISTMFASQGCMERYDRAHAECMARIYKK